MIRIRPGRSWRHNPGYVGKLRRLEGPHLQRFEGGGILDVLGIEVDGVDIAAGVGEAEILVAMDELCRALARIRSGSPAAQATVGRGPTELLLEARGADVLLALVSLAPPARFLASGLLLDGERLRAAAASAARALADDLLSISPALSGSPLLARLRGPLRAPLRKGAAQGTAPWPPAVPGRGFVARGAARGVRCEIQVPEESAWRLAGRADVPDAPLAALLGAGSLALRVGGSPALSWESPPYLALRDLVRSASGLVSAWEAGDADFTLRFGAADLHCDLTRDEVRANGWRGPVALPAPALATALAGAARAYATKALALGGEAEELSDLRDSARRIEIHCKDLASGNLRRTRSAALVPPPRNAPPQKGPLSRGRVRRLVYRESWKTQPGDPPVALSFCGGALIAGSKRGVRALDAATGREIFRADCEAFAHAANGDDLFLASPAMLSRIDPSTGERRWQRRMRSSAPLWPVARGLIRPTEDGIVCVSDVGGVVFEARLPSGRPEICAEAEGILLLAGKDLVALDAAEGRLLWKRKLPGAPRSLSVLAGRVVVLCAGRKEKAHLLAFSPQQGKSLWTRPFAGDPQPAIPSAFDCAVVASSGKIVAARLSDGTLRFETGLPFPGDAELACAEEDDARATLLLATGPGGACARIGERGNVAWSLPAEGTAPSPPARIARRLALILQGAPVVLDAQEGFALARIGDRPVRCAALADDGSVAICEESGALSLARLATHLSIVTT
jgi:outer membrane protein assembly factor BamB